MRRSNAPDLIVPDTGPLIRLAQADALHLLHQIGGRVVVADMVALEATQDMDKPGTRQIEAWIEAGRQPRSNAPVLIAYENGKIPRFVRETGLDLDADVLTTRAFLEPAERRSIVASAAEYRQRIVEAARTADPDINIMMQRRPGGGG